MKNKRHSLKELFESINKTSKILKESYSFCEEDEEMENLDGENVEETIDDEELINQIRDMALNGIQAHKDSVDDGFYMFYKSIWEDVDKFVSKATKENEEVR